MLIKSKVDTKAILAAMVTVCGSFCANEASASPICMGNCGFSGPDGVVTASPQGGDFGYVTSNGGATGAGEIASVGGTDGSQYSPDVFSAKVGDSLQFYFNYVSSDGTSSFPDYGFASLSTSGGTLLGYLFTAETTPTGNTSPGFGLPANISTLTPAATPIIPGAPAFSPLGGSSGTCYGAGCGYTGWIKSDYSIAATGDYQLTFGVTNFSDTAYDSALAFDGATIAGTPIGGGGGDVSAVPLPPSLPMFGAALLVLGALGYARRSVGNSEAVAIA